MIKGVDILFSQLDLQSIPENVVVVGGGGGVVKSNGSNRMGRTEIR